MYFIDIDIGTQDIRVLIVDEKGNVTSNRNSNFRGDLNLSSEEKHLNKILKNGGKVQKYPLIKHWKYAKPNA